MKQKYEILPGLEKIIYGTSEYHKLLNKDDNIGENGENLTIVVLSCDRSNATIKMMRSIRDVIPNYKGKYLIADNGSTKNTLDTLYNEIKQMPYECNIIEFGENYGVAKGRNKAIEYVDTEWFMTIDNDVYFTMDTLPEIHDSISQLGCHFLNIPLMDYSKEKLFSIGGNIFLSSISGSIHAGCGCTFYPEKCEINSNVDRSLSTFLFGTVSVMKKETFLKCGEFDEGMFVGFEDLDFSIAIFKYGYKIGCAGIIGMVHDHQKSTNENDIEYEKKRFSNVKILEAAIYFEKKHGFKVWNEETEKWLKQREKELGIISNETYNIYLDKKLKSKIAIVVDIQNWALDNIAKNIVENLSEYFDFNLIYMSDLNDDIIKLIFAIQEYDLIHFLWRGHINYIESDYYNEYLEYFGYNKEQFKKDYINNLYITTSVYDHKFINDEVTKNIFKYVKHYTVSSKKLLDIYNENEIKKPTVEITDGVNLKIFKPIQIERLNNLNGKKLKIGWVGNSNWCNENIDIKGVNTILKPAIEELINEGYKIESYFADKQEKFIPHDKMNEYYSNIDLYVCTSLNEGTPNPVLEAMACGIPVVSTDVGIVREVFGKEQSKYILETRSKECLKEKIKYILGNLDIMKVLSEENIESVKNWDWKYKTMQFKEFFDNCINEIKNNPK